MAYFGAHPGCGDQDLPMTPGNIRVHECHVHPVAERHVRFCYRVRVLLDSSALSGQGRFFDLERCRRPQHGHRPGRGPRHQRSRYPRDDLVGFDRDYPAIPPHLGNNFHHPVERSNTGRCLCLLVKAERAMKIVRRIRSQNVVYSWITRLTIAAMTSTICMYDVYCSRKRSQAGFSFSSSRIFLPELFRRAAASAALSPCSTDTPRSFSRHLPAKRCTRPFWQIRHRVFAMRDQTSDTLSSPVIPESSLISILHDVLRFFSRFFLALSGSLPVILIFKRFFLRASDPLRRLADGRICYLQIRKRVVNIAATER